MHYSKKNKKLNFQFAILFSFKIFDIQLDFIFWYIALGLDYFIMNLFLKLLNIAKILLINSYQIK